MMRLTKDNHNYRRYKIGNYTYGEPKIKDRGTGDGKLSIGSFCSLASELTIFLGSEHKTDLVSTYPFDEIVGKRAAGCDKTKGDVIIGNDVWIGFGVIILSGVTIGDGAVIGAGSLVSKNVAPYTIAAGNPCKVIRKRFSDEVIKKLLEIKWWDWTKEDIIKNVSYLESTNIDDFVNKFYNGK